MSTSPQISWLKKLAWYRAACSATHRPLRSNSMRRLESRLQSFVFRGRDTRTTRIGMFVNAPTYTPGGSAKTRFAVIHRPVIVTRWVCLAQLKTLVRYRTDDIRSICLNDTVLFRRCCLTVNVEILIVKRLWLLYIDYLWSGYDQKSMGSLDGWHQGR
jgi:hypothetical protein